MKHNGHGNCWDGKLYQCAPCGHGNLCDICHDHDEPRGNCSACSRCDECDELDREERQDS